MNRQDRSEWCISKGKLFKAIPCMPGVYDCEGCVGKGGQQGVTCWDIPGCGTYIWIRALPVTMRIRHPFTKEIFYGKRDRSKLATG